MNHNTLDNREENLQVMTHAQHMDHHHTLEVGRWSVRFDTCIRCHKTDSPHAAKGICRNCNNAKWKAAHPDYWRTRHKSISLSLRRQ